MKITIKISDMTCDHCKMTIEKALNSLTEIDQVKVNLEDKKAQVSGNIEVQQVVDAIRSSGYAAEEILDIKP